MDDVPPLLIFEGGTLSTHLSQAVRTVLEKISICTPPPDREVSYDRPPSSFFNTLGTGYMYLAKLQGLNVKF